MIKISRALISVYDKKNIVELARSLSEKGVEIISTGGTAKLLTKSGIKVIEISDKETALANQESNAKEFFHILSQLVVVT